MGQAYLLLEQPIDALGNIDAAMKAGDDRPVNYKMRGLANIRIGDSNQALKDLTIYQNLLPDDSPELPSVKTLVKQLQDRLSQAQVETTPAQAEK
jgi:regulator of sirC expression with transglutaminase-like and TPR domain